MANAKAPAAPKRARKTTTRRKKAVTQDLAVVFLLDKSGSMYRLTDAVIAGFNEYIGDLLEQEGETLFSLTLFDTHLHKLYEGAPLTEIAEMDRVAYVANGGTSLYDAIASTTIEMERRLIAEGKEDTKVLIVTMTDGRDENSREYTAASLAALVGQFEKKGNYTFVYLGLGQTQQYVGSLQGVGYIGENGYLPEASVAGVGYAMASLGASTATLRSSAKSSSSNMMADAGIIDVNAGSAAAPGAPIVHQVDNAGGNYESSSLLDHLGGH